MKPSQKKSGKCRQPTAADFTNACAAVNEQALEHLHEVLEDLLDLDIKVVGNEIQMLNPLRQDYEHGSFSISTETGKWGDFAVAGFAGGDVISLVAKLKGCGQGEALKMLQEYPRSQARRQRFEQSRSCCRQCPDYLSAPTTQLPTKSHSRPTPISTAGTP